MRIKRITAAVITAILMITMSFSAFAEVIPVIDMGTFHNVYTASDGSFNLSEWDHDITNFDENEYIVLEKYNGTDKEITIEGKARKNGKECSERGLQRLQIHPGQLPHGARP